MAVIEQVPVVTSVTVLPDTVHPDAPLAEKLTGRPEDAVAETVNGGVFTGWFGSGPKVMVWASLVTWKLCVTLLAAA